MELVPTLPLREGRNSRADARRISGRGQSTIRGTTPPRKILRWRFRFFDPPSRGGWIDLAQFLAHMLRADADTDEAGGNALQPGKPAQHLHRERRLEFALQSQGARDDVVLDDDLRGLGHLR